MASPLFAPTPAFSSAAVSTEGVSVATRLPRADPSENGETPTAARVRPTRSAPAPMKPSRARYLREASALLLFVSAVLTTLALASYTGQSADPSVVSADWVGPVGAAWASFLAGTVGILAWAVPLELACLTWPLLKERSSIATVARFAGNILSCFVLAALVHVALPNSVAFGTLPIAGSIGELFGEVLRSLFSTVGAFLVGLTAVALIFIGRQSFSFIRMAQRATHGTEVAASKAASGAKAVASAWERAADLKKKRDEEDIRRGRPLIHEPSPTALALVAGMEEPSPDDLPRVRIADGAEVGPLLDLAPPARVRRSSPPIETPAELVVAVADELVAEPPPPPRARVRKGKPRVEEPEVASAERPETAETVAVAAEQADLGRVPAPPPEQAVAPVPVADAGPATIQIVEHVEASRVEKPAFTISFDRLVPAAGAGFRLPRTDFFDPPSENLPKEDPQALYERANQLTRVLATYGVSGTVADIHTGPTVSTFELVPEEGTRVNKVAGLSDDLALGLACPVRIIAPIPNKNRIGFEIPNKDRIPVNLRELVEDRRFIESTYPLPVVLGRDIVGKPFFADLAAMPHVIVAGATGAGKSVGLNVMLTSLLTRRTPDDLRMLMIDPKVVELAPFDKIPHLLLPVVTDMKQAANALKWAVDEMERRYQLFANAGTKNIATFNGWVARCARGEVRGYVPTKTSTEVLADGSLLEVGPEKDPRPMPEKLPYIVIVVDEFADLMMQQGKDVEVSIARLAQKARAAGMHVILATQRPSVDVITGMIKANFPTRIAFKVTQKVDSRTILDEMGADQLLGRGDMLVKLNGTNETRRVQCPFVSEEEVQRITDFLRLQGEPVYDERILAPRDEDGSPVEDEDGELDAKYDDAVRVVAETRRCSTSWLQRKLGLGYNRAAKIVETMEKRGIVGPANGAKDREVLIAPV